MGLITSDLRTWLLQQPAVTALLEDRVYLIRAQQNAEKPFAVMTLVSTNPTMSSSGYSRRRLRRVQLDLYSDDADEAAALADAVRDVLLGFEGMMGDTHVQHSFLLSERDLDESEVELFRRSQDWELAEET